MFLLNIWFVKLQARVSKFGGLILGYRPKFMDKCKISPQLITAIKLQLLIVLKNT